MGIESDFLALMPDTVTITAQASIDKYGKRTHSGAGTQYSAHVEPASELYRNADGREVAIIGKVFLFGAPAITPNHKIVLPDGSVPVIAGVEVLRDEDGTHHTVIMLGA